MKGFPLEVRHLLNKARESALLAVETHNRPTALFRSGAYIVLMCIAWTALFHAIFRKKKVRPWYRKQNSRRYQKVDGDYRAWELSECLNRYYQANTTPERKNLELLIGLRNKIEHRSYPQLDAEIFGECQACLMNFEDLLCAEFGEKYMLKTGLAFSIQFSRSLSPAQVAVMNKYAQSQYKAVKSYIDTFRSSLAQDIQKDGKYSFKVFLVPKIGNHATASSLAIEFIKYDPSKPEEMIKYDHLVAMIKPREVPVINLGYMKPGEVVKQVAARTGRKFTHHIHRLCYLRYNIRKSGKELQSGTWDTRYCQYDSLHKDYAYNNAWVEFLVEKLKDQAEYDSITLLSGLL